MPKKYLPDRYKEKEIPSPFLSEEEIAAFDYEAILKLFSQKAEEKMPPCYRLKNQQNSIAATICRHWCPRFSGVPSGLKNSKRDCPGWPGQNREEKFKSILGIP